MKIEKKIIDGSGITYLISDMREADVGDIFCVLTTEEYKVFKEEIGTQRQNRFFHAAVSAVYKSHGWSIAGMSEKEQDAMSLADFREWVKVEFGQGYEKYAWIDLNGRQHLSDEKPGPDEARLVIGYIKSWSKYSKRERSDCISAFISWSESQGLSSCIEKYRGELMKNDRKDA